MTLSMTCGQFEDVLPQILDDDAMALPPAARFHIEGCVECKALLEDLTSLRTTAAALPPIAPSRDLWAGIEARIRTPVVPLVDGMQVTRPPRQISLRSAAAAAAVLALINAGVSYRFMNRPAPATTVTVSTQEAQIPAPSVMRTALQPQPMMAVPLHVPVAPAPSRMSNVVFSPDAPLVVQGPEDGQQPRRRQAAKAVYDREITQLRAVVDSGRHRLDPATVALLDRNLRIIDTAIEECNVALLRDSTSSFLLQQLNNAYQTKVKLLRIAAAAASRE